MLNEDFPSDLNTTSISLSSSSGVESALINEITWSCPQMDLKPAYIGAW